MLEVILEIPRHAHGGLYVLRLDKDTAIGIFVSLSLGQGNGNLKSWQISCVSFLCEKWDYSLTYRF